MSHSFSIGEKVNIYISEYPDGKKIFLYSQKELKWAQDHNYIINQTLVEILYKYNLDEYFVLLSSSDEEQLSYHAIIISENKINNWGLDKSFLNRKGYYVNKDVLEKLNVKLEPSIKEKEGYKCCICRDYYDYAIANQSNGTFGCYRCKTDPRNGLEK